MMVKKLISSFVVLSLVSSLLVACGTTKSSSTATNSNATTNVRTVQVASAAESKPLSWKENDGVLMGYEPDVLRAVEKKLPQYKFVLQAVSDEGEETGLATGKYDIAAGGYYKTDKRASQFLIPSENDGVSLMEIYVKNDSSIQGMKDLVGKKIVPPTTGGGVYNFIVNWEKENPTSKLTYETSSAGIPYPQRLQEVASGKWDALILPTNLGESDVIAQQKLPIRTTAPVQINKTYLILHKSDENQKLLEDVNKALKELKDDGTLSTLAKKYFGEDVFKYQ